MALSLPGRKKDLSSTKKEDVNIASVKRDNPKQENPSQDQKVDWAVSYTHLTLPTILLV